ncbi:MAG: amino acid adenylation domain-containing protein [Flavobacteriales bacterium]|nr:amino acid adenylation domain-containing protein [Flavobacteriales bacterium]
MRRTDIPLHPSQNDVYVDQLIHSASPHYNIGGYIKLKGKLDLDMFQKAVNSAAGVFDAFKMRFQLEEEEFRFFVDETFKILPLSELDFSSSSQANQEALEWMQNAFNQPFEFNISIPLFDHSLIKISDNEHWFFGKYHHLITDGYGFIVFVKYIADKYKSLTEPTEEVVFQFPSYIEEAQKASEYIQSDEYNDDRKYWLDKISQVPPKILQRKSFQSTEQSTPSKTFVYRLSAEQQEQITQLENDVNTGIFQLTLAALFLYFGKTNNLQTLYLGIPVHKRSSKRARNMVGMFSGLLLFKGEYNREQKLKDVLDAIKNDLRSDYRHQNYPIGDLSRDLKLNAADGYLYEVSVNYEPLNFSLDFGQEIEADIKRIANEFDRNPLQLCWREYGKGKPLELHVHYLLDYFYENEVELMVERVLYILSQFAQNPDKEYGKYKIIPNKEFEVLEAFNKTDEFISSDQTILDLFEAQVNNTPNADAIIIEHTKINYKELNRISNQIAHYLIKKGVGKSSLVPICIERDVNMISAMLGVLKTGAAYVPIDPDYPLERINYMLNECDASYVLTSKLAKNKIQRSNINLIDLDDDWQNIALESQYNPNIQIFHDQLAYIIFTSGSEGRPKGVMIEHGNVYAFLMWCKNEFAGEKFDIVYAGTSICFDLSVFEIFFPLSIGKKLRLLENGLYISKFFAVDNRILTNSVPSVIQSLVLSGSDISKIKVMNMAGESIPSQLHQGLNYKDVSIRNLYGPSEDTTYSTCYKLSKENPVLIGKPISNTFVFILNHELEQLPIGSIGEIFIGGSGLARGYLNSPELTESKFIKNPLNPIYGERLYRTGDIGRILPEGNIEFLGRIDNQVKIRGFRIELGEIEAVLIKHPSINEAVVMAHANQLGEKKLVAYVIPTGEFDKEEVIKYLKNLLPDFMIPLVWIEMENWPFTPNGKIDRKSLPIPETEEMTSKHFVAASNATESTLVLIWKELLNVQEVGVDDNFFELGGHSLNAIQLTSRIFKILNIKIDVELVFSNPTVRKLSMVLAAEKHHQFEEIEIQPQKDHYELSHAQKRFWILSHFSSGSEAYNNMNSFVLKGKLNRKAFNDAFNEVIKRHEVLRTRFIEVEGEVYQKIVSAAELGFKVKEIDLSKHSEPDLFMKEWINRETRNAFEFDKGPLLKAALFILGKEKYVFAINIHHLISDGWSKSIFIQEVFTYYHAILNGEEAALKPLALQYKDYAAWHLKSILHHKDFWKEQFRDGIPVLNFPTDFPRPKVLSFFGGLIQKNIPDSLVNSLRKMAVHYNMTLNNFMVSLYGLMVSRLSKQEDVVIGVMSSGRSHIDLENLIGVFINFLPVRMYPKRESLLSEYLQECQKTLSEAYNHQDYPFDLMVDNLVKKRDVSRNPMFDTMVNFHLEQNIQSKDGLTNTVLQQSGLEIVSNADVQEELFQSVLDFKLDIEQVGQGLSLYLSYNTKLFEERTMLDFLESYLELLGRITANKDLVLNEIIPMELSEKTDSVEQAGKDEPVQKTLPVYICSSYVAEPVTDAIQYWSEELEVKIDLEFAPYNQVFQQLMDTSGKLWTNKGVNLILFRPEDWIRDHSEKKPSEKLKILETMFEELKHLLENIAKSVFTPFLMSVCKPDPETYKNKTIFNSLVDICTKLESFISGYSNMHLFKLEEVANLYSVDKVYDHNSDKLGHIPFSEEFYAAYGTYIMRKLKAFKGPVYKVIALDCDNTLWKGICGETGALGVEINEHYKFLQEFILKKYNEGFLLVLTSKNNENDVWEVFEKHPDMILKREHISSHRINWQPKSDNLASMASELSLGVNSFIFLDDSEYELEQVNTYQPDIFTVHIPENSDEFEEILNHTWEFDVFGVTAEDLKRNSMYRIEKKRKEEQVNFVSVDEFVKSLNIEINIRPIRLDSLERSVQLTMRTNQFNLNGIRKTPEDISAWMEKEDSLNWTVEVRDRFGDYGMVGLILASIEGKNLFIETFLLSCRVLGRKVEQNILGKLMTFSSQNGLDYIVCNFIKTKKNMPFEAFLESSHWEFNAETGYYQLPVTINQRLSIQG